MSETPQTTTTFEIFDKFGHFVMPSAEQVQSLDEDTRARFMQVQEASAEHVAAKGKREEAENAVKAAEVELKDSNSDLLRLRPKITHTQLAKEFIASERAR